MKEFWYSEAETGFKTCFSAETQEDAEKKWREFQRIRKCKQPEDFMVLVG